MHIISNGIKGRMESRTFGAISENRERRLEINVMVWDISAIEGGKQNLTIETLIRIGRVLGINEVTISIIKKN